MKHVSILGIASLASLAFLLPHPAVAQYSPRDFFRAAPASTFYTEDEMSDAEKAAIIKDEFKHTTSFTCSAWGVAQETPQSLLLKYCQDSFVGIHVYPSTSRDPVVIVESSRSSGRASSLQFFVVKARSQQITMLPPDKLRTIGIESVTENDLVTEHDKFKDDEVEKATMLLDEDGRIRASVDTWMNPRWEQREIAYDIVFEWNGERFQKHIRPLARRPE